MLNNLMRWTVTPAELGVRALLVYLAVLLLLRISGKRQLAQMSATEFVAILLISNAVQNAMNGGDNSLIGGLVLAAVLIFLSWAISLLTFRSKKMSRIFEGTPILLVHNGKIIEENLAHERITHGELRARFRQQGIHQLSEVQSAILEADGVLSIFKNNESVPGSN